MTASVHLEKTSSEEVDKDYDYDYFFTQARKINFRYETKSRTVMVHLKFDALYRYVSIESLPKSGEQKS